MTLSDRIRWILLDQALINSEFVDWITDSILSEIRKVVPEEEESSPNNIVQRELDGWNACRKEILERLR